MVLGKFHPRTLSITESVDPTTLEVMLDILFPRARTDSGLQFPCRELIFVSAIVGHGPGLSERWKSDKQH